MNQEQRKFLIERVNKTFEAQKKKIESKSVDKPSLNNYLISAFLDDTIKFNDIEKLKEKMKKQVLKMGTGDVLIKSNRRGGFLGDSKSADNICEVVAEDLFIIPQSYLDALKEYTDHQTLLEDEINQLEAQKDTILLKIQIGSNVVLDKLITQVDNLADLNIMNSQFLLS